MIEILTVDHLTESVDIIKDVITAMQIQGVKQWDEIYPTKEDIYNDIQNNHAFGYFQDGVLCAYIVLNDKYGPEYDSMHWLIEGRALIVHRLSVTSAMQGKGIAKKCMLFAEYYAKKNGYNSIRLDAFLENPAALKVYDTLGYKRIGTVSFRKGLFYCYERQIH